MGDIPGGTFVINIELALTSCLFVFYVSTNVCSNYVSVVWMLKGNVWSAQSPEVRYVWNKNTMARCSECDENTCS